MQVALVADQSVQVPAWKRWLFGDAPPLFLVEVFVRTVVVYAVLVVVMRFLGKRMSGQSSNLELGVMLVLGAIISGPLQIPEAGLFPAVALLVSLLLFHRLFSVATARFRWQEVAALGRGIVVVRDGAVDPAALRRARLSPMQLFSMLRAKGLRQLGETSRVYLEACGKLSVLRLPHPRAGLSLMPAEDERMLGSVPRDCDLLACGYCGAVEPSTQERSPCRHCDRREWTRAVAVEGSTTKPSGETSEASR
jgi:uncharacterized membrane protein YcaP (DUF421 family)